MTQAVTQPRPLHHLAIVAAFMLVACATTYLVPPLHGLRPWIPKEEGIPIVRLFRHWGEIPAFAGHGGSYRASSTAPITADRLAETVGEAVAANLGTARPAALERMRTIAPSEYEGIEVLIEDPTGRGMSPFYRALEKTAKEEPEAITRVAHYGDSSIATDLITSTVRENLQHRFGDGGHGFVIAAKGYIPYKHRGVRQSSNEDNWITREVVRRQDRRGHYGYGGVQSRAQQGAWARVGTAKRGEVGRRATRFDIYYQERPRGGTFSVRLDGGQWAQIDTKSVDVGDAVYSIEAPDGPHQVQVRHKRGGPVHFYGFVVERDGPGIVYDSLGLVGARANRLLNFDSEHIANQLRLRGADLVVLGFGGNEASDDKTEELFYEDYARVLAHVRQGREDLGCLVFAPLDQASRRRGRIRTMESLPKIVAAQRRAAFDAGCAFYNTWEAMGGPNAMRRWFHASPRLAMGDFRHATPAGYEIIGNMFYKALLAGFADYLATARSEGPPSAPAVVPNAPSDSTSSSSSTPSRRADRSTSPSR